MIKVFDYEYPKKGWIEFSSYAAAKAHIEKTFNQYWLYDRDNCCTCYMEIYNDGEYEVWRGEFGSWFYLEEDESPYKLVCFGPRSDFPSLNLTALHPRKDYILIYSYLNV